MPSSPLRHVLVLLGALAACSGPTDDGDRAGAALDSSACARVVPADDPTTTELQRDLVARLSGAIDIVPGTRLPDRASPANRQLAREHISSRFEEIGLAPVPHDYGTGINVVAELPSTTVSADWIVLGAHYDTVARSPGANDNATGVALVVGVARELRSLACRSKNVAFVLFDQEEIGLVGSRAYAKKLEREHVHVLAVHTVDQMGWDANDDRLIELERPDNGLADLYRTAAASLGASIPMVVTTTTTSDHSSFRPMFPAIGLTEGYRSGDTSPDYHRPTDTFDKVDLPFLLSTTRLVVRVLTTELAH